MMMNSHRLADRHRLSANIGARLSVTMQQWYVVAGLAWFIRYATLGRMPWQAPIWSDWFDQSRYFMSATAFSHGNLTAGAHWYPLAYPLLAAPFAWLTPRDPFFTLDLLLFLLTCHAFQRVAARLSIGCWPATWCFLATTLVQTGLASSWAHPWTTTLSAALIWWLADHVIAICAGEARHRRHLLFSTGALLGSLPLVRPLDAVPSMTCALGVGVALYRQRDLTAATLLSLCGGGSLVCGTYLLLHLAIYGPHLTPYMVAAAKTGFIWNDLGWKFYVLVIDPRPWFPNSKSMLEAWPWIVPGAAGLIATAMSGSRRERLIASLLLMLTLPVSVIMLTYADLQPPGLWEYGNIHYFKWTMPAFGCGVMLCWRLIRNSTGRLVLASTTLLLLLPLGIRIRPAAVDEQTPARMLLFDGNTRRNWQEAYFASTTIVDAIGLMRNVGDFHQIPDPAGERAIAISRLFGSRPRRTDPGEMPRRDRQPPYARFGERITYLWF